MPSDFDYDFGFHFGWTNGWTNEWMYNVCAIQSALVNDLDPAKTIFLGDCAKGLPAVFSIVDATSLYNTGSQRPVYKAIRTDTGELIACTKITKSSLDPQDGLNAPQHVCHKRSLPPLLELIFIVSGGLTWCSGAGPRSSP